MTRLLTGGSWLNLFPSEMELGDVLGELGALVVRHQDVAEMTWALVFSPDPPIPLREPTVEYHNCYVLDRWPEAAPLRVLRAGGEADAVER